MIQFWSMTMKPINILNEPIKVYHANLLESDDNSMYRRECPFCEIGLFMVRRDNETFVLEDTDNCISCGQQVIYMDIDKMRAKENFEELKDVE